MIMFCGGGNRERHEAWAIEAVLLLAPVVGHGTVES